MPAIDWDALDADKFIDEAVLLPQLLAQVPLTQSDRSAIVANAAKLVERTRAAAAKPGVVEGFLQQFSLGTQEGLALMCLAEALLRTPDAATRDRLIAEKVGTADWAAHLGQSSSLFVNASTIGLTLTGKLVGEEGPAGIGETIRRLAGRLGEPVIRRALAAAVGIMGDQFVLGSTIEAALKRAAKEGYLCSFDMLGEGARTPEDAERYERIYAAAIEAVGSARAPGSTPEQGHGVSVKLSALCPRYEAVREDDVFADLYPRMKRLALIGAQHNLNLAIDAEEADRLALSLKLVDRLARESELGDWTGLGVVVQAYGKRARGVIDRLERLSRDTGRRIMVRLVKGAYWDSEVKRAQIAGHPGYPVFTSKAATDLSYLVCAHKLIAAAPALYPQFATHNAHSLMAVRHMADRAGVTIEHQRLHGMGEGLYRQAAAAIGDNSLILRAYAPVGGHEELLPYLVRRLLENGANSSFVNALLDEEVPATTLVADPVAAVAATPRQHPRLPSPSDIYPGRANPLGRDYSIASVRATASAARATFATLHAGPIVGGQTLPGAGATPVVSPVDHSRTIGSVTTATPAEIDRAAALARAAQPRWNAAGGVPRGKLLRAMADALDAQMDRFIAILSAEAGKTLNDAVAEVREAVDFCRYYAVLAETRFAGPTVLPGPVGEVNQIELHGRGVFVCISPWNFPFAIFTGQVAAALAAGNAVLAKPAEQTPLVAAEAVRLFHAAGLDPDLLALLPGDGAEVGAALVAHPAIAGVAFTGGTDTAWAINRSLANRNGPILPFIAETGGLNGLFVDTSALREQVVDDVLLSAFGSAGQRCSALRLLYLPRDTADATIETLVGAAGCMVIGDPSDPATDIGPVIDRDARDALNAHVERLEREATILFRGDTRGHDAHGTYFAPVIAEVPSPDFLEREVFGPVLHIYRYDPANLADVASKLAARGYGLTLGIHSRIDRFAEEVAALVPAGNVYVNRSIIGAVVGVQPFGGEGLSGTGPKAGGPDALLRYAAERSTSINIMAKGGDPALLNL
ncbi:MULTISPECIES: bifunctional proline dehydrogenase/L-glutamate gamma-semialdehyde dehydrogenase PutA [unclassified Sphingomonas]|uniref:bifunctional proline dehydrogenase/L-glutamate gamma-semialdehyde dehydrogenase PutA n=1 Tax=unclassified Sphingomonas TaxID=196159 RepID=UPI0006F492EC|nr:MULTISPECIES: bifunctional proline dehydrogenase/L-glutamate gamma-semialdehyde dehydrogenase PutA [unclassified Sphingomonas]KQM28682.1 integrase [Sphingomonas sp. Leaf9]KQM45385.1 integrase [Sphingomonas sp. Leaf11]